MDSVQFQQQIKDLQPLLCVKGFGRLSPDKRLTVWRHHFNSLSPLTVAGYFSNVASRDEKPVVTIRFPYDSYDEVTIDVDLEGRGFTQMEFAYYPNRIAALNDAYFPESTQGSGQAKRYLHAGVALAQAMNMKNLQLVAEQIGGYAWAKFGFVPADETSWNTLKIAIRDNLDLHKHQFTSGEIAIVEDILAQPYPKIRDCFCQLTALNRTVKKEVNGLTLTPGKYLLMHTIWNGDLPLDAKDPHFKRFQSYVAPVVMQRKIV